MQRKARVTNNYNQVEGCPFSPQIKCPMNQQRETVYRQGKQSRNNWIHHIFLSLCWQIKKEHNKCNLICFILKVPLILKVAWYANFCQRLPSKFLVHFGDKTTKFQQNLTWDFTNVLNKKHWWSSPTSTNSSTIPHISTSILYQFFC